VSSPDATRREVLELTEQTRVGALYLRALMRRQIRLSLGVAAVFVVLVGGQPLIPEIWPQYGSLSLFGLPLPWLILGVLSYPAMLVLGIAYVRRADVIDDEFTDLLS
jgi:hypothetical protein